MKPDSSLSLPAEGRLPDRKDCDSLNNKNYDTDNSALNQRAANSKWGAASSEWGAANSVWGAGFQPRDTAGEHKSHGNNLDQDLKDQIISTVFQTLISDLKECIVAHGDSEACDGEESHCAVSCTGRDSDQANIATGQTIDVAKAGCAKVWRLGSKRKI